MITLKGKIAALLIAGFSLSGPSAAMGQAEEDKPDAAEPEAGDSGSDEVMEILDEESEALEEEEGEAATEEAEEEEKEAAQPAAGGKGESFSEDLLEEEESVDWDASFQKEFETEKNEVVTPSMKYEDLFYAVPSVTPVLREETLELNATDLSTAAEKVPGLSFVHLQDSAASPVMGGLYGSRLQLLFDGIRLSGTLMPSDPDTLSGLVDLYSLNSIEVMSGPSTVLYGTGALGGVIHFIPNAPRITPFVSKSMGATGFFRYSTLDASVTTHADTTLHTYDSGLYAAATYEDRGSLTSSDERQPYTGFGRAALTFITAKQFLTSHEIKLGYFFSRATDEDRLLPVLTGRDHLSWDFNERHLLYLRYSATDVPALDEVQLTGGFQLFRMDMTRALTEILDGPRSDRDRLTTGTVFGLFHLTAPLGGWGSLIYGMDYYFDRANVTAETTTAVAPETFVTLPADRGIFENGASSSSFEHYLRMELYALQPLFLSLGGRVTWDYVDANTPGGDDSHMAGGGAQLEMRIPVVSRLKSTKFVTLSDVLAFNVIASYGARPPTLDEMAAVRSVSQGILFGNPDLDLEHAVGARGGLKWNAGILEGLLYYGYTHFESFILAEPLDGERDDLDYDFELCAAGYPCWIQANAGKADLHTLEFLNRLNIREFLTIGLLLNYTNGTQENGWGEREPMSYVPPLGGAFWLRARYARFGLWGEFSLRWAIDQEHLSTRDLHDPAICPATAGCGGTDWYLLLAFRGGVRITNRFLLSFMFHNLMNRMQKTHGSLLHTPGIGATVSIEVRI